MSPRLLSACLFAVLPIALSACHSSPGAPDASVECANDWAQWGLTASHWGLSCAAAQPMDRALAPQIVFDPFVPQEQADALTDTGEVALYAHYQAPLIAGDWVYMEVKSGEYHPCNPDGGPYQDGCGPRDRNSQVWNESAWHWEGGNLVPKWTHASGWKPVPYALVNWEPVFSAALAKDAVYIPEAGGAVAKVNPTDGSVIATLRPFSNADTFVTSPLTVADDGTLYYTALQLSPTVEGFLVQVKSDGTVAKATFASLVPDAPGPKDACAGSFGNLNPPPPLPWPPSQDAVPPFFECGAQRPAVNAAPAVGPDGTVFVVSRAHHFSQYAYVVAVNPDLSPKWASSLRGLLKDGCGVTLPADATDTSSDFDKAYHCRAGAKAGVDPRTNALPAAGADDDSSASPVALPKGGVLYGGLTFYNQFRGHLLKFDHEGAFQKSYDFGWDITPALWPHDGTYSIITKDNRYLNADGGAASFQITQLDANLVPEWSYANTNRYTCERAADGGTDCVNDGTHWDGFEWCVNAPAVDKNGTVYVDSEDGNLYAIKQGGMEASQFFLNASIRAAYTPTSIDAKGRIYALNGGTLTVIGGP